MRAVDAEADAEGLGCQDFLTQPAVLGAGSIDGQCAESLGWRPPLLLFPLEVINELAELLTVEVGGIRGVYTLLAVLTTDQLDTLAERALRDLRRLAVPVMTTTIWTRREDAAELQCLFACRLGRTRVSRGVSDGRRG
jgi:hypothetical protein